MLFLMSFISLALCLLFILYSCCLSLWFILLPLWGYMKKIQWVQFSSLILSHGLSPGGLSPTTSFLSLWYCWVLKSSPGSGLMPSDSSTMSLVANGSWPENFQIWPVMHPLWCARHGYVKWQLVSGIVLQGAWDALTAYHLFSQQRVRYQPVLCPERKQLQGLSLLFHIS